MSDAEFDARSLEQIRQELHKRIEMLTDEQARQLLQLVKRDPELTTAPKQ